MSSDEPGPGDWTNPGQPAAPPPFYTPPGAGWSSSPPPPPPYGWAPSAVPQAPRPGVIPLRPLAVGELLDGAFTTIRRYPAATLGLSAAVMLVVEAVQLFASYYLLRGVNTNLNVTTDGTNATGFGDTLARTATLELIVIAATLVATALLSGILAAIVGEAALGRPMSAGQAWQATRAAAWQLLGATGLIFVIFIGITLAGALPGIVIGLLGVPGAIATGLAIIGGFASGVYAIYICLSLAFTTPALMLEKQGIRASMSRSRALVKESWWRVFGILVLTAIIAQVIAGIIGTPFALAGGIGSLFSGHPQDQFRFTPLLLTGIGGLLGATLVRPFSAGVIALLYLDRRMRAEALDLTLQQAAATTTS